MSTEILLVEDNDDVRRLMTLLLERAGYRVITATNGQEAISLVGVRTPDLILMDLVLPVLDGARACALLKARRETADIPIIVVSAQNTPTARAITEQIGCEHFLAKPFELDELLSMVKLLTRRNRALGA